METKGQAVLGTFTTESNCTSEETAAIQEVASIARAHAVSKGFESCLRQRLGGRDGVHGPYRPCATDPLAQASTRAQIDALIGHARSANPVSVRCGTRDVIGSARGLSGTGAEEVEFHLLGRPYLEQMQLPSCADVIDPARTPCRYQPRYMPMAEAANIVWHEAMHVRRYRHSGAQGDTFAEQCGYPAGTWNMLYNSAPFMVGHCMKYVFWKAAEHCPQSCGANAVAVLADHLDFGSCYCQEDPAAADWSRVEIAARLVEPLLGQQRLTFDARHRSQMIRTAHEPQVVEFEVVRGLPMPLAVEWSLNGLVYRDDETHTRTVSPGDVLQVTMRTNAPGVDASRYPAVTVTVNVDPQGVPRPSDPPQRPFDLTQDPPVRNDDSGVGYRGNGILIPEFNPATGIASIDATLGARTNCRPGWSYGCELEFRLSRIGGPTTLQTRSVGPGESRTVSFDFLPAGGYIWSARTLDDGVGSAVAQLAFRQTYLQEHFRVTAPERLQDPVPPHDPIGVSHLLDWATGMTRLSAITWDLNDDDVTLEFEVRDIQQNLVGTPTHSVATTAPDVGNGSLRRFGQVTVPSPEGTVQHFRVRAVDATGRSSAWVDGGEFPDRQDLSLLIIDNWVYRVPLRFYLEALGLRDLPASPGFDYWELHEIARPRGRVYLEPSTTPWSLEERLQMTSELADALRDPSLLPVGVSGVLLEPWVR